MTQGGQGLSLEAQRGNFPNPEFGGKRGVPASRGAGKGERARPGDGRWREQPGPGGTRPVGRGRGAARLPPAGGLHGHNRPRCRAPPARLVPASSAPRGSTRRCWGVTDGTRARNGRLQPSEPTVLLACMASSGRQLGASTPRRPRDPHGPGGPGPVRVGPEGPTGMGRDGKSLSRGERLGSGWLSRGEAPSQPPRYARGCQGRWGEASQQGLQRREGGWRWRWRF